MSVVNFRVPARKIAEHYKRTRYTIVFDPTHRKWCWKVTYEATFTFEGTELTPQSARVAARKKIDAIKDRGVLEEGAG